MVDVLAQVAEEEAVELHQGDLRGFGGYFEVTDQCAGEGLELRKAF